MSPEEHRGRAEILLLAAQDYPPHSPVRLAYLAEAQVHATLALAPTPTPPPAPRRKPSTSKETPK